jgi:two-component system response regulator AlgR
MKILVVDDEHLARDRLKRMLSALDGYEMVGEAANGMEAVKRCE